MTSASASARWARSVRRSSAPDPAPTSETKPLRSSGRLVEETGREPARLVRAAGEHGFGDAPSKKRDQKRRRGAPLGSTPSAAARKLFGEPRERAVPGGSIASMRARMRCASTGPAPVGGDGDGDRCAVDQSGREKIAEIGLVDGVHRHARGAGGRDDAGVEFAFPGRREGEHGAVEIARLEGRATCSSR